MRTLILHNEGAGGGRRSAADVMGMVRAGGFAAAYRSVGEAGWEDALSGSVDLADSVDLAIIAGGDGTVVKVLTRPSGRAKRYAVLPLGGANNIAGSLGITGAPADIARNLDGASVRRLAIGTAHGPWGCRRFVEAIGIGALARSLMLGTPPGADAAEKLRAGRAAFRDTLVNAGTHDWTITADGARRTGRWLLAEVMNINFAGPRLMLAPCADPGDGLLDVVCLEADQQRAMIEWLDNPAAGAGPPLTTFRAARVTIDWDGSPLHIDDTYPCEDGDRGSFTVSLDGDAVDMLVPHPPVVPLRTADCGGTYG